MMGWCWSAESASRGGSNLLAGLGGNSEWKRNGFHAFVKEAMPTGYDVAMLHHYSDARIERRR